MPVYEYACKACDHEFELEQRIRDKPAKKCPKCGAMKAKRLISRTSFVLKGSGWYSDLYAKPPAKKGEGAPDEGKKGEAADKGSGSDASPSGKSESGSGSSGSGGGTESGSSGGASKEGKASGKKRPPDAA